MILLFCVLCGRRKSIAIAIIEAGRELPRMLREEMNFNVWKIDDGSDRI